MPLSRTCRSRLTVRRFRSEKPSLPRFSKNRAQGGHGRACGETWPVAAGALSVLTDTPPRNSSKCPGVAGGASAAASAAGDSWLESSKSDWPGSLCLFTSQLLSHCRAGPAAYSGMLTQVDSLACCPGTTRSVHDGQCTTCLTIKRLPLIPCRRRRLMWRCPPRPQSIRCCLPPRAW